MSAASYKKSGLTDLQRHKVATILDKRTDGDPILLDWNAIDPSGVVKETDVKDVYYCFTKDGVFLEEPNLTYDDVADELRKAVEEKKKQLLEFAKQKALERMLDECRNINLVTIGGAEVRCLKTLSLYFKQACRDHHRTNMTQVTTDCFKETTCWHEDLAIEMRQKFGLDYDQRTIRVHKNRKGNGFIEKVISRGVCNQRQDLYGANARAEADVVAPRKKRQKEVAYAGGTYDRIRNKKNCACPISCLMS